MLDQTPLSIHLRRNYPQSISQSLCLVSPQLLPSTNLGIGKKNKINCLYKKIKEAVQTTKFSKPCIFHNVLCGKVQCVIKIFQATGNFRISSTIFHNLFPQLHCTFLSLNNRCHFLYRVLLLYALKVYISKLF